MTHPRWIYALQDPLPLDASPAALLGGKGLSLRRLAAAGLKVPRGFTITTAACRETLRSGNQWPDGLETQLRSSVAQLEQETGRLFGPGPDSLQLAVRSGAEVSMPGMLETILNCGSQFSDLTAAIQSVFESWNSDRARAWRTHKSLNTAAGTAVTVQELIAPACSGVLFTMAPAVSLSSAGEATQQMAVEAISGRGDALVSGNTTPQCFAVDRQSLHSSCRPTVSSPLLSSDQLRSLAAAGLQLEKEFGQPLDVEWGLAGTEFVFFQARPITSAVSTDIRTDATGGPASVLPEAVRCYQESESRRLSGLLADGRVLVRHNLSETLPAPTPMTWSIVQRMMSGRGGLGQLYRTLGYSPATLIGTKGFLELAAGRVYADPDRMIQLFTAEWPLCHDHEALRQSPDSLDTPPRHFDPDRTHPLLLLLLPHLIWILLRSHRRIRSLMQTAGPRFQDILPAWKEWVQKQSARDLSALTRNQLLDVLEDRVHRTVDIFAAEALLPGTVGAIAITELHRRVAGMADIATADRFRIQVLSSLNNPIPQRQAELLGQLADGKAALPEFLAEFGHRGPLEMELSQPRWNEQPPQSGTPQSPRDIPTEEPIDQTAPALQLQALCSAAGQQRRSRELQFLLSAARELLPLRESGRHQLMAGFALIRECLESLSRASGLGEGIYFLQLEELRQLTSADTAAVRIEQRRNDYLAAQQLSVPDFLDLKAVSDPAFAQASAARSSQAAYDAAPLSPGRCQGPVTRISISQPPRQIPENSILVTSTLDPCLVPLLLQAQGVVVERGGVLSHGAVVARQLGIPVARCPAALQVLQEGQHILLNSTTGCITLLSPDSA